MSDPNPTDRIAIVQVEDADLRGVAEIHDEQQLRALVRQRLRSKLLMGAIVNPWTGWIIGVSWSGFVHASGKRRPMRAQLISLLSTHDLLRNAVLIESIGGRIPDIAAVHTFVAAWRFESETYRVYLTVREHRDGRRFYDQSVVEMTTPAVESGTASGSSLGSPRAGADTISIDALLQGIKGLDFPS